MRRRRESSEGCFDLLERVSSATLLCLQDKADARGARGGFHGGANRLRLVTDDHGDGVGGHDGERSVEDVEQKGLPADFVQHFRALALETCSLSGGHDGDAEAWLMLFAHEDLLAFPMVARCRAPAYVAPKLCCLFGGDQSRVGHPLCINPRPFCRAKWLRVRPATRGEHAFAFSFR